MFMHVYSLGILLHIRQQDCVSIEVRYHRSCFKNYTRCLDYRSDAVVNDSSECESPYRIAYEALCKTVITDRIIKNKEIFRMTSLLKLFTSLVTQHEGIEVANYRTAQLKLRLKHQLSTIAVLVF